MRQRELLPHYKKIILLLSCFKSSFTKCNKKIANERRKKKLFLVFRHVKPEYGVMFAVQFGIYTCLYVLFILSFFFLRKAFHIFDHYFKSLNMTERYVSVCTTQTFFFHFTSNILIRNTLSLSLSFHFFHF